jgi:NAD(P)-dependent dehydrogenase (short-subunit alcohol dehydrogenase family)
MLYVEKLSHRAALVTGGGRRIGAGIAKALAADGWFVYIHCHKSADQASEVLEEIRSVSGNGKVIIQDLSKPGGAESLMRKVENGPVPLMALINNASLFEYDTVETITEKSLDEHFAVNVRGPTILSKVFASLLSKDMDGCIINILDNKVYSINPDYLSYTISKVALQGATSALAMALAPKVRVNGIAPGITLESGNQGSTSFIKGQTMSPMGQVSSVEDITRSVLFILHSKSINGNVITIDGGQSLQKLTRDVAFID